MTKTNQKIPEGWSIKKLADCCSMSSGGTPSKNNSDFWNGDIPWISASAMRGIFFSSSEEKITELGLQKGSHSVNKGDLLLLVRGSMLWNCIPIGIATRKLAFNQDVKGISVKNNITNQFLLYWFKTNEHFIKNMVVGTGIGAGKLDTQELNNIKILLPPLAEQKKIAEILSCWDEGIEKLSALIEKKKIQKKALMQQLLTGKHRLKGFKKPWIDVDLASILQYEQPSKYLVDEVLIYNKSKIPVLTANKAFILGSTNDTEGVYNKGDCIIFDDFTTDIKYVDFPFKIKSSAIKILTPLKSETNLKFVFEQMKRLKYPLGGHKRYYLSEFQYLPISLPCPAEQKAIADILSKADEEIELLNKKLEAFKLEKKALMQKLLTGQIRVKVN